VENDDLGEWRKANRNLSLKEKNLKDPKRKITESTAEKIKPKMEWQQKD